MRVRPYCTEDEEELKAIHSAQDLDYPFPELASPLFIHKLVVLDEEGKPRVAGFARVTAEVFILSDPELDSEKKKESLQLLLTEAEQRLVASGLEDLHAFIPPKMNGMHRLLCSKYGFEEEWPAVCKQLGEYNGT